MRHRNRGPHDRDHGPRPDPRYQDMPSVSNGPIRTSGNASSARTFGYPGQSGHDVFSHDDDYQRGPGGYGQDQGRHAQSGHGRGGSQHADSDRHSRGSGGHRGRGPRNYRRSDESIADELVDRFTDHPDLDATQILLQVEDGEVTLTGEVPERRMKHLAEDIAAELHGVAELHNRIRVDDGKSWLGPPGEAVRSGNHQGGESQIGSGFSSSGRLRDPLGVDERSEDRDQGRGPSS
ncbi:BON domain-containing protein [Lysobacter sp. GX 14042]|uniref:BON domain-containing protein n=1 Tax=Lysobacter sp. GX 14042 TaxID=2907155 RepID=UPI001F2B8648|nr:BON domain-containing protein [Lysobacter sp. GX 14042]MCE7031538.1 BON domain-containing protein [Lysobacter sp. GX 14042]